MDYHFPEAGIQQIFPSLKFFPKNLFNFPLIKKKKIFFNFFMEEMEFAGSAAYLHKNMRTER